MTPLPAWGGCRGQISSLREIPARQLTTETSIKRGPSTRSYGVNEPLHFWTWRRILCACEQWLGSNKAFIECIWCLCWAFNGRVMELIRENSPVRSQVENWYICYGCQEMWPLHCYQRCFISQIECACVCAHTCTLGKHGENYSGAPADIAQWPLKTHG